MITFSVKNAFRKKITAILTSIGVAFGLMLVFVVGAFTSGLQVQFQENLTRTLGIVNIVEASQIGPTSILPTSIIDEIQENAELSLDLLGYNVQTQTPYFFTEQYSNKLVNNGDRLSLVGLNLTLDIEWKGFSTKILEGRTFTEGKNETIISNKIVNKVDFSTKIGDDIQIRLDPAGIKTVNLTIVGYYESIEDGTPPFVPMEYYIYTDIQKVWEFLNITDFEDQYYTSISLRYNVNNHDETQSYVQRINDISDEGGFGDIYLSAFALATFYEAIEENLSVIDTFTAVLGLITVIAGGMAIIVSQLMSVSSRLKEFAILKATGWKNRHIFINIIIESLTLGILGAFIGIIIGFIFIHVLSGESSPFGSAPAVVTVSEIVSVFLYAISLGVLGGLYPGLKATSVRPVKVLKNE